MSSGPSNQPLFVVLHEQPTSLSQCCRDFAERQICRAPRHLPLPSRMSRRRASEPAPSPLSFIQLSGLGYQLHAHISHFRHTRSVSAVRPAHMLSDSCPFYPYCAHTRPYKQEVKTEPDRLRSTEMPVSLPVAAAVAGAFYIFWRIFYPYFTSFAIDALPGPPLKSWFFGKCLYHSWKEYC